MIVNSPANRGRKGLHGLYVPKRFQVEDEAEILSFIQRHPFGTLICMDGQKPIATHIPLELEQLEGKNYLSGHVAYGNPQWKVFEGNPTALAVFQGPHTYISSSWYGHVNVPTWNYTAVHVYGRIEIVDTERLKGALKRMLERYESHREGGVMWESLDESGIDDQIRGIVGFQIEIQELQASYKMSQNRDDADFLSVVHQLDVSTDPADRAVADVMRKLRPQLFADK